MIQYFHYSIALGLYSIINDRESIKHMLKLKILKIVLILVVFFSYLSSLFIFMCLRDVPVLSSLLTEYIASGKSFFIPILPYINILGFIPHESHTIQFSLGHLIDIIIIYNIICYIDTGCYHYFKNAFLNEDTKIYFYISLGSLGLNDESIDYLENKSKGEHNKRDFRLNEKIHNFYENLRRKIYTNKFNQNRILHRKSKYILYNRYKNLLISCYHSNFESFLIFRLINHYHLPKINNFADFNKHFIGEGGKK